MQTGRKTIRSDPPHAGGGRPVYEGILQAVGNGHLVGWVRDSADPQARVTVTVAVDGEIVAEGVADKPRDDLAAEAPGDGAHGFELALPDRLSGPGTHVLVALAGPERSPIKPSASFWSEGRSGGAWEQTVFVARDVRPVEVAPSPQTALADVVEGPDGWLFEAADLRVVDAPTPAGLAGVRDRLRALHDAFAEIRIPYVAVRVPARHVAVGFGSPTYGETVQRLWVEPLMALLCDEDDVELVDLLPVLRACARHGPAFGRTAAEWNARGAFFAARAILKEVNKRVPDLRPPPLAALHLRPVPDYRGPLGDRLSRGPGAGGQAAEDSVAADEHHMRAVRMPVEEHLAGDRDTHVRLYTRDGDRRPGISLVGGEPCLALLPWLAECAGRTTFFWTDAPPLEPIELEMPGVVIHLVHDTRLPDLAAAPLRP